MRLLPALKPTFLPPSSVATDAANADAPSRTSGVAASVAIAVLRAYKVLLSPLFTGSCRCHPSCSDYMREAVEAHGARRGVWLGLVRLSRCRPFGGHGYDPVPR